MQSESVLSGIGSRWQSRIAALREYDVIREGNIFGTSFADSYVYQSEFDRARELQGHLLRQHEGSTFDDVFSGVPVTTEGGECTVLLSRDEINLHRPDPEGLREAILSDLTLIFGIGEKTAGKLKSRGFRTITDLTTHPKYRASARTFLRQAGEGTLIDMIACLSGRHPATHPLVLGASGLFDPESLVFLDIETLGLFSRPIILFGLGRIEGGSVAVSQYLLKDVSEEHAALLAALSHLEGDAPALVSFNGKTFDIPYIRDRLAYYGTQFPREIPHFDILHCSRRRWKHALPDCRLTTLEKHVLGIERQGDLPSQMVPEFYETYLMTGNPGPLVPIVTHNRQDVISLARLYGYLMEEFHAGC
jgi:uncharacterized protein YprB with RNaseH-like and TPR domain